MKFILYFSIILLSFNVSYSQNEKSISEKTKEIINDRIELFEKAISETNHTILFPFLSEDFTSQGEATDTSKTSVLPEIVKQLPESTIIITEINSLKDNDYHIEANMFNMVFFKFILNKEYQFKEITVKN